MSEVRKNSEDYWREMEQIRNDPSLVNLVASAASGEIVTKLAEDLDYPTHMCRQARLLHHFRNDPEPGWRTLFEASRRATESQPETVSTVRKHSYPCEWEDEVRGGIIRGTYAGTLVVEKNAAKAAVLWDYTLLDEDGEEVCHSRDLSRDSSMREGLRQINCYLNCGSKLLPRTGLKITFGALASELCFRRVKSSVEVCWERLLEYGDPKHPCITRRTHDEGRSKEKYKLLIRPLSEEEDLKAKSFNQGDAWGLFITTSFLKHTLRAPHVLNFPDTAPISILFDVTSCYEFRGRELERYISGKENILEAERSHRFGSGNNPFDIKSCFISKSDQSSIEGIYKPHERHVEDILVDLADHHLPHRINFSATIEQMCDIRRMGIDLFDNSRDWSPNSSILVKA